MAAYTDQVNTEILTICRDVDLIVAGVLVEDQAQCVADAQRVPLVCVHLAPYRPNRSFPHPLVTTRRLPPLLNLATHAAFGRLWWRGHRAGVGSLRRQLGLPLDGTPTLKRMAATGTWELQAYSRVLTPALTDYPARRPIVGSLDLDADLRVRLGEDALDADLDAWLSAGPPPVYFGFGSMPVIDPAAMLDMIRRLTEQLGVRALVGAGWSRLGSDIAEDRIRVVGEVLNYDRVFPRCRLAVHHGGSGTVAASVAAGTPTLVCSVFADNGFWGARVRDLGVGEHLPFPRITPARLAAKMDSAWTDPVVERCREVGRNLTADRGGSARAADLIERVFR
jgi:sterol 3beta-glucosyltransferase